MNKIIFYFLLIQFYYAQDKGLSSFEKKDYKQSYDFYLNVLNTRKNDISAKFGAGISAFKNQDIETGMKYLQEVSNSEDEILSSRAHFNIANIYKDENKLEESLYHYKKAIELNSKDRDSKINYELLKKMLSEEDKGSEGNPGDEGDTSEEDKGNEGNPGDKGDKNQEDQGIQNSKPSDAKNYRPESEELSDKQIQAEAILNALKSQEKINQKQKLIKFKAKTLEKDW